eukprot:12951418-Ditylum_brightwellii.AAC.2
MDVDDVVNNQQHLTEDGHTLLQTLSKGFEDLSQGKIGVWLREPIELKLKDLDMEPFHAKPYSVLHSVMKVFKQEIERLVELKVLKPNNTSLWTAPLFGIPKKNGQICFVTDFRKINEAIRRSPHLLPLI